MQTQIEVIWGLSAVLYYLLYHSVHLNDYFASSQTRQREMWRFRLRCEKFFPPKWMLFKLLIFIWPILIVYLFSCLVVASILREKPRNAERRAHTLHFQKGPFPSHALDWQWVILQRLPCREAHIPYNLKGLRHFMGHLIKHSI